MRKYSILAAVVICLQAATVRAAEVVRVACVGDSITYGAGVANRGKNNYPKVLGGLLGAGYESRNFGVSGATLLKKGDLPYWRTGAFKAATEFKPHIVIIKLGTNDSKPQNWKHRAQYAVDLAALVDGTERINPALLQRLIDRSPPGAERGVPLVRLTLGPPDPLGFQVTYSSD